jgi:hypothetical protein
MQAEAAWQGERRRKMFTPAAGCWLVLWYTNLVINVLTAILTPRVGGWESIFPSPFPAFLHNRDLAELML